MVRRSIPHTLIEAYACIYFMPGFKLDAKQWESWTTKTNMCYFYAHFHPRAEWVCSHCTLFSQHTHTQLTVFSVHGCTMCNCPLKFHNGNDALNKPTLGRYRNGKKKNILIQRAIHNKKFNINKCMQYICKNNNVRRNKEKKEKEISHRRKMMVR